MNNKYEFFMSGRTRNKENILKIWYNRYFVQYFWLNLYQWNWIRRIFKKIFKKLNYINNQNILYKSEHLQKSRCSFNLQKKKE